MEIGIIAWIVVGLIAGILGKLIMPGRDPARRLPSHDRNRYDRCPHQRVRRTTPRRHGSDRVQRLVDLGGHFRGDHTAVYLSSGRAEGIGLDT